MTSEDLDQLVTAMRANAVSSLLVEAPDLTLRLVLPADSVAPMATAPTVVAKPAQISAKSPGIGTYAPRGLDDGLEPIVIGQSVASGEVLGYVALGSARQTVCAPIAGTLTGDLPEAGRITGYGDTLLTLEPSS
ncbi:hypothetical protein [Roseibium algae]|uniref:Lipoyl-binding domain-containing protein n=1 Tax=Roseibium algae TaxID=3123038 RepID=A0ABU8TJA8_9HYPH